VIGRNNLRFSAVAAGLAIATLSACGGGGSFPGGALPGGSNSITTGGVIGGGTPTPAPRRWTPTPPPTPTPVPTATPTPYPSTSPQSLPILTDNSQTNSGVFLGAVCTPQIPCSQFANTFRHGLAVGVVFLDWSSSLSQLFKWTEVGQWNSMGITPEITWKPTNLNLIDIANGKYDSYIISAAQTLKGLGYPVYMRPFHEFNGFWYSWGLPNQGASPQADANFIAAWRHMVDTFRAQGATNVKFIWCFAGGSIHNPNAWDNPAAAYPGDSYVDWVGFDNYNRGTVNDQKHWLSFDNLNSGAYNLAVQIAPNKPVMWAEGAANEYGDGGAMKGYWIQNMLNELASPTNPYPHLREITWFELDPTPYMYDSLSSTPAYTSFVWNMRSYNQNGVLNLRSNNQVFNSIVTP